MFPTRDFFRKMLALSSVVFEGGLGCVPGWRGAALGVLFCHEIRIGKSLLDPIHGMAAFLDADEGLEVFNFPGAGPHGVGIVDHPFKVGGFKQAAHFIEPCHEMG